MRSARLLIMCLLSTIASANPAMPSANVVEIAYGTSFGECLGYCNQEVHISGRNIEFLAGGRSTKRDLDDVRSRAVMNGGEAEALWRLAQIVKYTDFPERIGCPDCTDGGVEWLEFRTEDHKTKKIAFEFGKAPLALRALVARCSQIQRRFKTPDDWRQDLPIVTPSR